MASDLKKLQITIYLQEKNRYDNNIKFFNEIFFRLRNE
jgi:hypothetical protein